MLLGPPTELSGKSESHLTENQKIKNVGAVMTNTADIFLSPILKGEALLSFSASYSEDAWIASYNKDA